MLQDPFSVTLKRWVSTAIKIKTKEQSLDSLSAQWPEWNDGIVCFCNTQACSLVHFRHIYLYVSLCSDNMHFRYLSYQEEEWMVVEWQVDHNSGTLNSCVCTKAGIFEEMLAHFRDIFQPCLWPKKTQIFLWRDILTFYSTLTGCVGVDPFLTSTKCFLCLCEATQNGKWNVMPCI